LGIKPPDDLALMSIVDNYGSWPVIEGVLSASTKKMDGDPWSYVVAVAKIKWREDRIGNEYTRGIERSKQRIAQQNEELEQLLERAKQAAPEDNEPDTL
jgi:hypothetical protein